jgi:hypothetical protein
MLRKNACIIRRHGPLDEANKNINRREERRQTIDSGLTVTYKNGMTPQST